MLVSSRLDLIVCIQLFVFNRLSVVEVCIFCLESEGWTVFEQSDPFHEGHVVLFIPAWTFTKLTLIWAWTLVLNNYRVRTNLNKSH